jgi:hypothetical protein
VAGRNYTGVIPQMHLGIRFRSTTEARWAQFFHDQKIPFSYEPDAVGNGREGYSPDFQFTGADRLVFFEVKPTAPTRQEYDKLIGLAKSRRAHVFVSHGPPSGMCCIEKVYSDGTKSQWFFAYEHERTCGYLVECLYSCGHAIALRKTDNSPGIYGRGPETELDAAGNYQFDDPLAPRRVKASPQLRRVIARQLAQEREVLSVDRVQSERKVVGRDD